MTLTFEKTITPGIVDIWVGGGPSCYYQGTLFEVLTLVLEHELPGHEALVERLIIRDCLSKLGLSMERVEIAIPEDSKRLFTGYPVTEEVVYAGV